MAVGDVEPGVDEFTTVEGPSVTLLDCNHVGLDRWRLVPQECLEMHCEVLKALLLPHFVFLVTVRHQHR
jgi:hypothetical protein